MIGREKYSKIPEIMELPSLVELQTKSYEEFLQKDVARTKRENIGLEAIFRDVFPIESQDGKCKLEFVNYSLENMRYTIEECQQQGMTYASALRVRLRLKTPKDIKEQQVYMGDIPIMTQTGSFIINGDERVVVSQLHRSPGVSFEQTVHPSGKRIYSARIIPYRGTWIEFGFDLNDVLYVYLDRRRKMVATILLRAIGCSTNEEIISAICGPDKNNVPQELIKTFEKDHTKSKEDALLDIYKKMRPGDPLNIANAQTFFDHLLYDPKRYDLGRVGRFVLNRKLNMKAAIDKRTLDAQTIINTVKYLLSLKRNEGAVDDIDHLGNRRIRTVGELLENQFRIGFARLERSVKERMAVYDEKDMLPYHLVNSKLVSSPVRDFFARSQLSQFMDQTNPLAELTHKRRLSALGPGGLSRERAGFEVRDVHYSHYGRICPIETPEGPNIGLISSLSAYARVNEFGFVESPYRKVINGKATDKIEYLSADQEDLYAIAQANAKVDKDGRFIDDVVSCRFRGDFPKLPPDKISYMDVSPRQLVSVAANLIPFLEHDDANRALMGSNMQRQAVPLMQTEAPVVGTGIEHRIAKDSGACITAQDAGLVKYVDSNEIAINNKTYRLKKFHRSNADTCINQIPVVAEGCKIKKNEVIADGPATKDGELALGRSVLVAFMPWRGYNFEDAILISERLVKEDLFTSIHIEEFEIEARETRLGNEEITRDIPNVSEDVLRNLGEDGIIRIGAEVMPGDILVGKVTPKSETELSPEEKLLRAIFGEKAGDVRDASLTVSPGVEGVVINVKIFSRKQTKAKTKEAQSEEVKRVEGLKKSYSTQIQNIKKEKFARLVKFLKGKRLKADLLDEETQEVIIPKDTMIKNIDIKKLALCSLGDIRLKSEGTDPSKDNDTSILEDEIKRMIALFDEQISELVSEEAREIERLRRGDELPAGVLKKVVVQIASKKKVSIGDKVAGRHGNKGVVAKILPEEDMPFLPDGSPVDMVLNPLGVPSRMNVGQILETHLGWAAKTLGIYVASPVFNGATEEEARELLKKARLPEDGKITLFDGFTGEAFDQKATVGFLYMMKLAHLVDDKIHARSIGPYSLVTQQPLGGKAQFGGQRFGEMEVWALEAYGAAYTLQELLTVKSDDVTGRTEIYEAIVKGENALQPGTPESLSVLVKELQGLGLDVRMERDGENVRSK